MSKPSLESVRIDFPTTLLSNAPLDCSKIHIFTASFGPTVTSTANSRSLRLSLNNVLRMET